MKLPKIVAHRGVFDNEKIVENTLESFKKAISYHYPIELDVQLTTDNQLVVFHDDDLKRLANRDELVQNMNSSELTRIKLLNTEQTIPYLKNVLTLNKDQVLLDIEIKPTKRIKETVFYLMQELEPYHNYVIISFDPRVIRYIKKHYPNVETGLLIHTKYNSVLLQTFFHSRFMMKYTKCDFLSISKILYKKKKIRKIIKDYPLFLWTIKEEKEVNYEDNISYVCNNLPYKKEKD